MRKRSVILLMVVGFSALLSGITGFCPHTSVWTPEIRGRVLDSSTRSPIQGAKVFFMHNQQNVVCSDATGKFRLKATRKFYLGSAASEGDWPHREKGPNYADISHTNYYPFWFFDNNGAKSSDSNGGDIGDILLKPISPKSDLCEIHHAQMVKKAVAIYYKSYPMDPRSLALDQASKDSFPHAEETGISDFYLAQQGGADIYVCSDCQKARNQWVLKFDSTH